MRGRTLTRALGPLMALALAAASTHAMADPESRYPGLGYGPGMMMGPGHMGGYGPGMMGGYGPGAMGAYGPNMMGPGMGYGPMGAYWLDNLTDAQQEKLDKIRDEMHKKQRNLMREMWTEQERLDDLMEAEKRDPAAIGKAYDRLSALRRQSLELHLDAQSKMEAVLSKEQREKMRRFNRRGMMGY